MIAAFVVVALVFGTAVGWMARVIVERDQRRTFTRIVWVPRRKRLTRIVRHLGGIQSW